MLELKPLPAEGAGSNKESPADAVSGRESNLEGVLVVCRPAMEFPGEEPDEDERGESENDSKASVIDAGLTKFAKKMPMFEPERVASDSKDKPLTVNLELALYRAKVLARNFKYEEAEAMLQKVRCLKIWFLNCYFSLSLSF